MHLPEQESVLEAPKKLKRLKAGLHLPEGVAAIDKFVGSALETSFHCTLPLHQELLSWESQGGEDKGWGRRQTKEKGQNKIWNQLKGRGRTRGKRRFSTR